MPKRNGSDGLNKKSILSSDKKGTYCFPRCLDQSTFQPPVDEGSFSPYSHRHCLLSSSYLLSVDISLLYLRFLDDGWCQTFLYVVVSCHTDINICISSLIKFLFVFSSHDLMVLICTCKALQCHTYPEY